MLFVCECGGERDLSVKLLGALNHDAMGLCLEFLLSNTRDISCDFCIFCPSFNDHMVVFLFSFSFSSINF